MRCGALPRERTGDQPVGFGRAHPEAEVPRRARASVRLAGARLGRAPAGPAVRVDKLLAEQDENEVRKSFTVSERVSIAEAIKARLGSRQGKRTDKLVEEFPQVPRGEKSREHAARKAGFGNDATYRQAKKVVDDATPELCQAMDEGLIAPSAAAQVVQR